MQGKVKSISAIICEDIRHEINGKKSVIGMKSGHFKYNKTEEEKEETLSFFIINELQPEQLGTAEFQHRFVWEKARQQIKEFQSKESIKIEDLKDMVLMIFELDLIPIKNDTLLFQLKQNSGKWSTIRRLWFDGEDSDE